MIFFGTFLEFLINTNNERGTKTIVITIQKDKSITCIFYSYLISKAKQITWDTIRTKTGSSKR